MITITKDRSDKLVIKQKLIEYYLVAGFIFLFSVILIFFEKMENYESIELSELLFPGSLLILSLLVALFGGERKIVIDKYTSTINYSLNRHIKKNSKEKKIDQIINIVKKNKINPNILAWKHGGGTIDKYYLMFKDETSLLLAQKEKRKTVFSSLDTGLDKDKRPKQVLAIAEFLNIEIND